MAGIAKSATTPTYLTTLAVESHRPDQASTVGFTKRLTVPLANHLAGDPTCSAENLHEQCSQTTPATSQSQTGQWRAHAGFPSPTGKP